MKACAKLTLLSSSLLSSSLLLACFGSQAAIIEVTESVSSVAYQAQQENTVTTPSTKESIKPVVIKQVKTAPTAVAVKPMPAVLPLPVKVVPEINPVINTTAEAELPASVPESKSQARPISFKLAVPVDVASTPTAMPTTIPVHPVLNTSALVIPTQHVVTEEPSLFSAISGWFSVKPVKPWQKGTLAKKAMKPGGEVPEFDVFSEKVFAYKQGSIGGNGVGGGGCGCN